MSPLQSACRPVFLQLSTLAQAPSEDRQTVLELLRQAVFAMQDRAKQARCKSFDILDATYALVALMDEQIPLLCPALAGQWRSALQQSLFSESRAGEGFFERLDELMDQEDRDEAIRVFALCLGAGFRGRYAAQDPDSLRSVREQVKRRLDLHHGPVVLAPAMSSIPTAQGAQKIRHPLLWATTLILCLGILSTALMRKRLDEGTKQIFQRLPRVLTPSHYS